MPHVEVDDYAIGLPLGAYHHDLDAEELYRLAKDEDSDYLCYVHGADDNHTTNSWCVVDGPASAPVAPTAI